MNDINEIPFAKNEYEDLSDAPVRRVIYINWLSKAQNKKYTKTSGVVYAEVNKKKEISNDHPVDLGDSSHVEVYIYIYICKFH